MLKEAKAAGIPVILTDRAVKVTDDSLYVTFIGSDFVEEGRKAAKWLLDRVARAPPRPSTSSSCKAPWAPPAIDRKKGFEEVIKATPRSRSSAPSPASSRAKGKEVMESFLKQSGQEDRRALRAQRRHGDPARFRP